MFIAFLRGFYFLHFQPELCPDKEGMEGNGLFITNESFSLENTTPSPAVFVTEDSTPLRIKKEKANVIANVNNKPLQTIVIQDLNGNIKDLRVLYTTSDSTSPTEVRVMICKRLMTSLLIM